MDDTDDRYRYPVLFIMLYQELQLHAKNNSTLFHSPAYCASEQIK